MIFIIIYIYSYHIYTHLILCRFSGLFEHLYEEYSRADENGDGPGRVPLPDNYSAKTVKTRIRNRVKHYLERRKRELIQREGVPKAFYECYKAHSAALEVSKLYTFELKMSVYIY